MQTQAEIVSKIRNSFTDLDLNAFDLRRFFGFNFLADEFLFNIFKCEVDSLDYFEGM